MQNLLYMYFSWSKFFLFVVKHFLIHVGLGFYLGQVKLIGYHFFCACTMKSTKFKVPANGM